MTDIDKLKIKAAEWFYTRETAQVQIANANEQLQKITAQLQKLQAEESKLEVAGEKDGY